MNLLKRFELWVLLAIIGAGLAYVFLSAPAESEEGDAGASTAETQGDKAAPLSLIQVSIERDYGNARLDLEVRVKNDTGEELTLQAPAVRLLTTAGREVPSFVLAIDTPPKLPAGTTQDVQLRYWLEEGDLQQGLQLEVKGRVLEVKQAAAFDLRALQNGGKKTFRTAAWTN